VGSLNRVKDHATLFAAVARVIARIPDVHLDIVGEDTLDGTVQRLAGRLGLARHVTFHGFQPNDALDQFHARAHLHVVSSRHEAAGVVTLEAAAAGVATVGTKVGYLADWAPEGRAVAVEPADADALGAAVAGLLEAPARRARIAEAARAWALDHDADWTASRFDDLYRDLARAR
jgi:glycosyltransferase involved in cell wall biosynthesis